MHDFCLYELTASWDSWWLQLLKCQVLTGESNPATSPSLENCFLCPSSLTLDSHTLDSVCPTTYKNCWGCPEVCLGADMLEQTPASHTPGKHPALGFTHSPVGTFSLELKQSALGEKDIFGRYYLLYYYDVQRLSCCPALGWESIQESCSVQLNQVRALCVTVEARTWSAHTLEETAAVSKYKPSSILRVVSVDLLVAHLAFKQPMREKEVSDILNMLITPADNVFPCLSVCLHVYMST